MTIDESHKIIKDQQVKILGKNVQICFYLFEIKLIGFLHSKISLLANFTYSKNSYINAKYSIKKVKVKQIYTIVFI
jgi:hypothetical protein